MAVSERQAYIDELSKATGLDPRVITTWIAGEGHPGDEPGYYNYMNIQTATANSLGVPVVGSGPAGTAKFGNIATGVTAALAEITRLGLADEKGKTPAQQISDIAASAWASSHYGGPGGPNLVADFRSMYDTAALASPGTVAEPTAEETQVAGNWQPYTGGQVYKTPSNPLSSVPVVGSIFGAGQSTGEAAGAAVDFASKPLAWVESSWPRILEVIAGGALVLVGVVGLMKEAGVNVPGPVAVVASAVPGGAVAASQAAPKQKAEHPREAPISEQPRRVQERAGFTLDADRKPKRGDPGSAMLAPGDSLPFD